ncbi:Uncharacterised protein [Streptococcus pneumoniae]|nr:Uncharacterised protein [Streptococcus pneumoniae]
MFGSCRQINHTSLQIRQGKEVFLGSSLAQEVIDLIPTLVHLLNDRIVGIADNFQTGKEKLINRKRVMALQITSHLFNDIGVLGITNGNQATMLDNKGHGKSLIVGLVLFYV